MKGSETGTRPATVALVGQPNVGKSVLFQRLTGRYVSVANYPGTTVEIARGASRRLPGAVILDTPGLVGLPSLSEDEAVTARVLLQDPPQVIVQVGDAKNLRRTLLLTVQLAEMGLPLVLALNMVDEAQSRGLRVDAGTLARRLGIPVVATVAITGAGMGELDDAIRAAPAPRLRLGYPALIEEEVGWLEAHLPSWRWEPRGLALLWLTGESTVEAWLRQRLPPARMNELIDRRKSLEARLAEPLGETLQQVRSDWIERIGIPLQGKARRSTAETLGALSTHPIWGWPILAAVLLGLYAFVGLLGAQVLVGWLERVVFGEILNPRIAALVGSVAPALIAELLVGPFGLWTMGMTYALALILPIVTTFFFAFGILEDSGYLPRFAVLVHRAFRAIGLNGKAVLPMVLGLGCVTMATVTTRILETRRERLLAILLLALAIPCSAQLGLVMGMLASVSFSATLIWGGVVVAVMLAVGWLASRLIPGERSTLLVELPPLRRPQISNVVVKTGARLEWYMKEVVPFFLAGAFLVFVLDKLNVLDRLAALGQPLVTGWLGLPPQAALAFLMGFLRRDFGAAGLFAMQTQGQLDPVQVVVAMVAITIFVPCIAAVMMIARERGWKTAMAIVGVIFPLAFLIAGSLRIGLTAVGWGG